MVHYKSQCIQQVLMIQKKNTMKVHSAYLHSEVTSVYDPPPLPPWPDGTGYTFLTFLQLISKPSALSHRKTIKM